MRRTARRFRWLIALGLLLPILVASPPVRERLWIPTEIRLFEGEAQDIQFGIPFATVSARSDQPGLIRWNGQLLGPEVGRVALGGKARIEPVRRGQAVLDVRLLGLIPMRQIDVDVLSPLRVEVGGQSIGISLKTEGVMVVGFGPVVAEDGSVRQPAADAGVRAGDVILAVDGQKVESEAEVARAVEEAGDRVTLSLRRGGRKVQIGVRPVVERATGKPRLGIYVRDGAAGIGTLTFVEPVTGRYMALGHIIADQDTEQPLDVRNGQIVRARVEDVVPSRQGRPGEKMTQLDFAARYGTIERNTNFGIGGTALRLPDGPLVAPLPVATVNQVRPGSADIWTVVSGERIERFSIEIVRVARQRRPDGKGMVIRITDRRLLERTGGIVQGMSGSPIVQDGRLVGAVTHVFVNDPTRGYAVFAEWMLEAAGLLVVKGHELGRVELDHAG